MKTLVNEPKSAGEYTTSWDCLDREETPVAPGVYILRLESDGTVWTHKITAYQ